jgi:hypothetical protein
MTTFTQHGWPEPWKDEFAVMMADVFAWSDVIGERRTRLLELLDDRQARLQKERGDKPLAPLNDWTELVKCHFRETGADNLIKWWEARINAPTAFLHQGRLLNKPSVAGKTKRTEKGVEHQRELLTVMTWDELRAVRRNRGAQRDAAITSIAQIDKLLELCVMCPEAANPVEAATILGLNLDEWLAS